MSSSLTAVRDQQWKSWLIKLANKLKHHWIVPISVLITLFVGLPWIAPLLMETGWIRAGGAIYFIYGFFCHQMPQRSFFLFGDKPMYTLSEINAAWLETNDPIKLRQIIGEAGLGWKVAWSDRMVYMYTTILFWGLLFWFLKKRVKPLPWWGFLLILLPMAVDGTTHMLSDFAYGIGLGFRDSNSWLAALTNNSLPASFYAGDSFGSFNSWMRLITGLFFGLGIVWFFYPRLHHSLNGSAGQIVRKISEAGQES